ncbi:hypothetical protein IJM16_00240 [Candidatus Saccharibacteria bacterium]|nr:hypothetical protein [Candidatus Saccharibacteria bacterium]
MNSDDRDYGIGAEAAHQADSIQKQMAAEAIADAPAQPEVDNSIMAGIKTDEEMKPFGDIINESTPDKDTGALVSDLELEKPQKEKEPKKKGKLVIICVIAVLVLGVAGVAAWLMLSNTASNEQGGAKADPQSKAFFVEGEDGDASYAIYNDKGEKLTDYSYVKESDFNVSGYAIVRKINQDAQGLVANTGKLSVAFGEFETISEFGPFYIITKRDADTYLTDGSGDILMRVLDVKNENHLYYVFDGEKSYIFDKNGEKVFETEGKSSIPKPTSLGKVICLNYKETACFSVETGDKLFSFKTDKKLTNNSISDNLQCATFYDEKSHRYTYNSVTGALRDIGPETTILALQHKNDIGCFFIKTDDYVMGSDGVKLAISNGKTILVSSAQIVVRDADHFAYYQYKEDGGHTYTMRSGGDTKRYDTGIDEVTISATNKMIGISYGGKLYIYEDGPDPVYIIEDKYIQASSMSEMNEYGNFSTYNYVVNKDKGVLYRSPSRLYVSEKNGYFVVRESLKDNGGYAGVLNAKGEVIITEDTYTTIKFAGDFFIAVKDDSYSLLDGEGKVLLEKYDSISVLDSHIEALKGGKTEYYTLDMKKIK